MGRMLHQIRETNMISILVFVQFTFSAGGAKLDGLFCSSFGLRVLGLFGTKEIIGCSETQIIQFG
jgi:hypothetical protein